MDSPYDLQAWADATSRGRRLYNYNFRMIGNELRGWDLVNVVPMENATEYYDVVYLWEKKGTSGRELVRIGVVEAADWRLAQYRLRDELLLSMRPDIPHGTGRLAEIGDVNYASQEPGGTLLASIIFSLGNVTVTVRSAGDKPVDVAAMARRLDQTLGRRPTRQDLRAGGPTERLPLAALKARKNQAIPVIDHLPERATTGWHKLIAPDGELRREDDVIVYVSPDAGEKEIEHYHSAP